MNCIKVWFSYFCWCFLAVQAFQAAALLGSMSLYTVMHMTLFYGVAPCDVSCCGCFCCSHRLTRRTGELLNTLLYMPFHGDVSKDRTQNNAKVSSTAPGCWNRCRLSYSWPAMYSDCSRQTNLMAESLVTISGGLVVAATSCHQSLPVDWKWCP